MSKGTTKGTRLSLIFVNDNSVCLWYSEMDDEVDKSCDSNVTEESLGSQDTDNEKMMAKAKKCEDKKWVHVERVLREDAYKNLAMQKRMILVAQCGDRRSERNISIPYGSDYLIAINNCRNCFETNIAIGKVYQNYWPKVDDPAVPTHRSTECEHIPEKF